MRLYDSLYLDSTLTVSQVNVTEQILLNNTTTLQADWQSNTGLTAILNKPVLSAVALTGKYSDLLPSTGQPIFNSNGQVTFTQQASDWNSTTGVTQILNKPQLSNLAISASWNDINPSTLPQFFNGNYASLTNKPVLSNVAVTGKFTDLVASSLPTISTIGASGFLSDATYSNGTPVGQLPSVVFSGKYADLIGIPSGQANTASLAVIATSGRISDALLANGATVAAAGIPANLLNISNLVTTANLSAYVTNAQLLTSTANLVTNSQLAIAIAPLVTNTQLITSTASLVTNSQLATAIAPLVTNTQLTTATASFVNNTQLNTALSNVVQRSNLSVIATSGLISDAKLANGSSVGAAYGGFSNIAFSGSYLDLTNVPSNQANASSLSTIATSGKLADAILSNGQTVGQAGNLKVLAFSGRIGDALLSNGVSVANAGGLSSIAIGNASYSQLAGAPTNLSQFTNDLTAPTAQSNVIVGPFSPSNTAVTLGGGMQQWQVSISSTYQVNVYVDGVFQTRAVPTFDTTGVHTTLPTVLFATNLGSGRHYLSLQASNTAYTSNSDVASALVTEFALGNSSTTSTTWQYPTLGGTWAAAAGFQAPSYRKTALGTTSLRGSASGGTLGLSAPPLFTLPATFAPSNTFVCSVACDGTAGEVRVYSNGAVCAVRGNSSGTYLSLDNIFY